MFRATVLLIVALMILCQFPSTNSGAQTEGELYNRIKTEHDLVEKMDHRIGEQQLIKALSIATPGQPIDVTHYLLQIRLNPSEGTIAGSVTITGKALADTSLITVDAFENLVIEGVRDGITSLEFKRKRNQVVIAIPGGLTAESEFAIVIDYHGTATTIGSLGSGMLVAQHGASDVPVMASLSEPYAAPSWWPCIDDVNDKATATIEASVPKKFSVASNGVLESVETGEDGTTAFHWREDYPIAPYLISVAVTNYERFADTYTSLDGSRQMPIEYFVYPEHLTLAEQKFSVTRRAIEIFAPLYGEYPFLDEKYGMAEFPWSGAMEHQTITSLGSNIVGSETNTGQGVIAHELAHHWWGDLVTMKSWHDIWLNEGFATYSEVLFYERYLHLDPGIVMSQSYDDGEVDGRMGGTVYAEDLADPYDDRGAIYTKGGWVLHMLRGIMGDDAFFAAYKDYAGRYAYSNASTDDFRKVCEDHYGSSLEWFFNEWIYAPGRPVYKVTYTIEDGVEKGTFSVAFTVKQKQKQEIPNRSGDLAHVYVMPIKVTVHFVDGTSETVTVFNDSRKQRFAVPSNKRPVSFGFDEDNYILKKLKLKQTALVF